MPTHSWRVLRVPERSLRSPIRHVTDRVRPTSQLAHRGLHGHLSTPLICDTVHPDDNLAVDNVLMPEAFKMQFVPSFSSLFGLTRRGLAKWVVGG